MDFHKKFVQSIPLSKPNDIFANGELSLEHLEAFGFDYGFYEIFNLHLTF